MQSLATRKGYFLIAESSLLMAYSHVQYTAPLLQVQESDDQLATTWKNQLMQFNNVSESMALAVVAEYHTPSHLLSVSLGRLPLHIV